MNTSSLRELLEQLERDGHLENGAAQKAIATLIRTDVQPWFVRVLIGSGAWIASLLLMGFIFGLTSLSYNETGFIVIGVPLVLGAFALRRRFDNDFSNQMSLAASFAGQGAIVFGVVAGLRANETQTAFWLLLSINGLLLLVHPDRIHRFLSTLFFVVCIIALLYVYELNALICLVGPALMLIYVAYSDNEAVFIASDRDHYLRPIMAGVVSGALGCLMLSGVYVVPDIMRDFSFYPRPWVSSVILGALLLYVSSRVWRSLYPDAFPAGRIAGYALTVAIIVAALQAPGLLLALLIIALGAAKGDRVLLGAGVLFLVLFTGVFFYGIETPLWVKSITLITTGLVVLSGRWMLLALYRQGRSPDHA